MIQIDGQPWFVAKEVCSILGLEHVPNSVRSLADGEKRVVTKTTNINLFTFGRGSARLTLVSEPGLYSLASRSNKPDAKAFDRWVRHDVLPAIRKDGVYVAGDEKLKTGDQWSYGT